VNVTIKQLLEAGVHFGHQTHRWNPKMRPYIFTERSGIHIIDLRQTLEQLGKGFDQVRDTAARSGVVLFVATKKQARHAVAEAAATAKMPFITERWLGGMLTNFPTTHKRILYMRELERMEASTEMDTLPKKEALRLRADMAKLQRNLGGVRDLTALPQAMFVLDVNTEEIAVREASRLGIPVIAVVDTNSDPDLVDIVIPGNDDAIRAAELFSRTIAAGCREGSETVAAKTRGTGSTSDFPEFNEAPAPRTAVVETMDLVAEPSSTQQIEPPAVTEVAAPAPTALPMALDGIE